MSDEGLNRKFHQAYSLVYDGKTHTVTYDGGAISSIRLHWHRDDGGDHMDADLTVHYRDGEEFSWKNRSIDAYTNQFGIAVSSDGAYIFGQTWERGLFCFDAKSGKIVWRTKSKRGITDLFVNEKTVLCHQHGHALQLLDIDTGEILAEKKPATAWGFTALNHAYIICQVTAQRWEIIHTETLETVQKYTHKEFTGGHPDFCVNHIELLENHTIEVGGFHNVWDKTKNPPVMLPNLTFKNLVPCVI